MRQARAGRHLLAGVGILVLGAAVFVARVEHRIPPAEVLTVAQVAAELQHDPQAWAGRTVVVRAIVAPAAQAMGTRPGFTPPGSVAIWLSPPPGMIARLALVSADLDIYDAASITTPDAVRPRLWILTVPPPARPPWASALLRLLPALNALFPIPHPVPPGLVQSFSPLTFRLLLLPPDHRHCAPLGCVDAMVEDVHA